MASSLANSLVITGGRRGLGSALAQELVSALAPARLVLTARSVDQTFRSQWPAATLVEADLGSAGGVERAALSIGEVVAAAPHRHGAVWDAILVHNSGSLSPLGEIGQGMVGAGAGSGPADLAKNVFDSVSASSQLNIASFAALTAAFVDSASRRPAGLPRSLVLNVSSLAAIQPFSSWGVYCAGKAFRERLMSVLAAEQAELDGGGRVVAFSYAPGPLDTDMQLELRSSERVSKGVRDAMAAAHREGTLVSPAASAGAIARQVAAGPSALAGLGDGLRADYFDLVPQR